MTIITLKCDEESSKSLRRHLEDNRISGKDEFHSTLFYKEEFPFFQREESMKIIDLPITIIPSYSFDLLGEETPVLVLTYNDSEIERLRDLLYKNALRQCMVPPETYSEEESIILRSYFIPKVPTREEYGNMRSDTLKSWRNRENFAYGPLHISLAKNFSETLENLQGFEEPLTFSELNWYHQEHL